MMMMMMMASTCTLTVTDTREVVDTAVTVSITADWKKKIVENIDHVQF